MKAPDASIKQCRRCKAAGIEPIWECRTCESLCCEHLCGFKADTHEATCGACQINARAKAKAP